MGRALVGHRKPKYVNAYEDRHGKMRIYLRRPGQPQVPLPGPLYSEPFWIAYHKAMEGGAVAKVSGGADAIGFGGHRGLLCKRRIQVTGIYYTIDVPEYAGAVPE